MRVEQFPAYTGVLDIKPVHPREHVERPQRDVAQIADRRGHHIKARF